MVPANKILTVAYGTFSCTLEGFDDPFSTMTDIAEYFRGLAAEDRYFGAEPPTPDMAMLRQIAETTSRGSVDARSDEKGVTLRPAAAPAVAADTDTAHAASDEAGAYSDRSEPQADAQEHADAPVDAADPDQIDVETIEVVEADAESAAAKLARIRDVVAADRAEQDYSEDEHAEDVSAPAMDDAAPVLADIEDIAEQEVDATSALIVEEVSIVEEEETILDTLASDEDAAEDENALNADLAALFADDEADTDAETEDPVVAASTAETVADDDETPVDTQSGETDVAPEADEAQPEAVAEETATEEPAVEAPAPPVATPRRVRVRKVRRAAAASVTEAAQDQPVMEDEPAPLEARQPVEQPDETPKAVTSRASAPQGDDAVEDDEAALMAELAAIEAELGRDATGATATDIDEDDDLDEVLGTSSEAPEDGDDLMAELAAIRAVEEDEDEDEDDIDGLMDEDDAPEVGTHADEDDALVDDDVAPPQPQAGKAKSDEPEDLERLFAATDSRLSGEDTSRRHANISHLKAAVAARRADDTMETVKTDDSGAYRKDLASTVRPRRAEKAPEEARTARPERAAPLMLVSEQRVEEAPEAPAAAPAEPVKPRRAPRRSDADARAEAELQAMVAARGKQTPDLGDDFEQFAQDVGATDLADILEAAAVYSATVMGQDKFSRPRLLHLAAEAVDDLSREDGLRGFGQLLRDGTLRKVSRGTFALGTESRFREQARRLVG
ncbi:hypothetical protein [Jannaschia sp. 2305UL9-9]|uniref:hypothetical protein n=1 Tax=Jannaschia sp. 2305UL9-9 TaxID=3121638 RepID=UPI0035271E0E